MLSPSKGFPSNLMPFHILLYKASCTAWRILLGWLNSVVTPILVTSTPSKYSVEPEKKDKFTQSKIRWVERLFQYGDVPLRKELPDAQHTQSCYFSNVSKSSVIISQTQSFFMSNWLAIIRSVNWRLPCSYLPGSLNVDLSSTCWRLPASEVIFHLHETILELLKKKNMYSTWCYLHTFVEAFYVSNTEFFPTGPD